MVQVHAVSTSSPASGRCAMPYRTTVYVTLMCPGMQAVQACRRVGAVREAKRHTTLVLRALLGSAAGLGAFGSLGSSPGSSWTVSRDAVELCVHTPRQLLIVVHWTARVNYLWTTAMDSDRESAGPIYILGTQCFIAGNAHDELRTALMTTSVGRSCMRKVFCMQR